ncbi:hypothetical protein [Mangrovicoccus sp. HB161399]|uniref:hypothetical protein n=1 Tax=Mangrovicoccus sp. HB161399 TaxID=2720392 RepID=UPI001554C6E4|nr:hypothetical protein [Mangrovicoccus sp. HB161399]
MFRKATLAALAIAATGAAFSAQASDQLATSLGVQPGQYTTSELAQIRAAKEAGDNTRVKFLLSGGAEPTGVNGNGQLALSLGVQPGEYTTAELVSLRGAIEDGDAQSQNYILSGTQRVTRNATASPAAADSQLGQLLRVDATQFSSGELGAMYLDAHD